MKLHRDLGTQKSAYFMAQRIRKAWESSQGKMFGHVEVDEVFFGSKKSDKPKSQREAIKRSSLEVSKLF